jgi:hypothetical protein
MTDYHVITPEAAELVMQVIDGELVIVPPVSAVATSHVGAPPMAHPVGTHLGAPAQASLQVAAARITAAPDK